MTEREIRVTLADDQSLVRAGFAAILDTQPGVTVVGEADNGADAVDLVAQLRPDVALMDIRMPVLDGIAATAQLSERGLLGADGTRVLVLTTFELDEYVDAALRAGASGFLLKTSSYEELTRAVRIVTSGDAMLDPGVTRRLVERYTKRSRPGAATGTLDTLTEREVDVLRLVAQGLSNTEIADELVVTVHTVKTHVSRLLTKLGLRDRVQAVILAYDTGLVRPPPP